MERKLLAKPPAAALEVKDVSISQTAEDACVEIGPTIVFCDRAPRSGDDEAAKSGKQNDVAIIFKLAGDPCRFAGTDETLTSPGA